MLQPTCRHTGGSPSSTPPAHFCQHPAMWSRGFDSRRLAGHHRPQNRTSCRCQAGICSGFSVSCWCGCSCPARDYRTAAHLRRRPSTRLTHPVAAVRWGVTAPATQERPPPLGNLQPYPGERANQGPGPEASLRSVQTFGQPSPTPASHVKGAASTVWQGLQRSDRVRTTWISRQELRRSQLHTLNQSSMVIFPLGDTANAHRGGREPANASHKGRESDSPHRPRELGLAY